jgi:hypothetical protein
LNRIRLLILLLGPLPIVGSSWVVSAWFKSEPRTVAMRNSVLPGQFGEWALRSVAPAMPLDPSGLVARECQRRADLWTGQLGAECTILVRTPFVIAGDFSEEELHQLYEQTMLPAIQAMHRLYFDVEPSEPVSVLLFRGEASYEHYCERLFGERGISIYGYYKPKLRTLVLNLETGKGTLLHELTHALADFDFPNMPDWLNEGLASLHEQSRFRDSGEGPWIEGLVNWRLKGLQEVAQAGQLGSLRELLEKPQFRGHSEGTNYAQARFFCMYMQERGLLDRFYRQFRDRYSDDPRGMRAFAEVFPGTDLEQLDRDFTRWMLELPAVQ